MQTREIHIQLPGLGSKPQNIDELVRCNNLDQHSGECSKIPHPETTEIGKSIDSASDQDNKSEPASFAANAAIREAITRANPGDKVRVFSNGSSIVTDKRGQIVKTTSASGVTKEFRRDRETGTLQVIAYTQWVSSPDLSLRADGTIAQLCGDREIQECLDGTTRIIFHDTGKVLETDQCLLGAEFACHF